jgi:hypothetical protein
MSQGILGKDGSGWAKRDVAESKQLASTFKAVVAAHKSAGGESGINLLSMTAPGADLPGFVQPSASEIQAARPYMMPGTFKLRSSLHGQLTMYAHFVLVGNQIVFTSAYGTTAVNELFIIEITPIPANNLLVSDGRQFDTGSFEQGVGAATVNVGYSFTASDFLVVIRNNQILDENLDFTRVIGSNGTGSTLTLTVAPTGTPDNMRVYGGIFFGNASVELFTQLERIQSAIQLLAADAAAGFYGDTNAARYLSAAPAEIDRMAFGALVTANVGENLSALRQYNLTVTGTGYTADYCVGVPYRTLDGTWRLKFNGAGTRTSSTSWVLAITGIVFASLGTIGRQAINANDNSGGSAQGNCFTSGGSNTFQLDFLAASTASTFSGDVALASKPSFVP